MKKILYKIRLFILKLRLSTKWAICILTVVVPLVGIFFSGSLLTSTKLENYASNIATFVKNNTASGRYMSFLVESDNEAEHPLPQPYTEYQSLHGAFRESRMCYAATANANKTNSVYIKEINSENLSILYSNLNSNKEYNGHFKHEFYPLELMFLGEHSILDSYSFCYLSVRQAELLMAKRGIEKSESGFSLLIGQDILIEINEQNYSFKIANIFLEENYFYQGLTETMGDFIFTYSKLPQSLPKEASYFFGSYTFQNLFYVNRIISLYSRQSFNVTVNSFNVFQTGHEQELALFFYENFSTFTNCIGIIIFVLMSLAFVLGLFFIHVSSVNTSYKTAIAIASACIITYLVFFSVFLISKSVMFFSFASTSCYFILSLMLFIYLIVAWSLHHHNSVK